MDLIGVLRACAKRWWVFLPVVALTAWLCTSQYRSAEPLFTSTAAVVVTPSESLIYVRGKQAETGVLVTSPFSSGSGDRVLTGLVARALNTDQVRDRLLPDRTTSLFAERDVEADATVVQLTVVATSAAAAQAGIETVVAGANDVASGVQRDVGVKDGQFFDVISGGPVASPTVAYPDRVRAVVGFALAGLLLSVVAAVVADSLLSNRAEAAKRVKVKRPGSGSLSVKRDGSSAKRRPKRGGSSRAGRPSDRRSSRHGGSHAGAAPAEPRRPQRRPADEDLDDLFAPARQLDLTGSGPGDRRR